MSNGKVYKVGSRKSELALIQTHLVIGQLKNAFPEHEFKVVTMLTVGDKILDKPLPKIGEKSLFTKELETALEKNEVDFVVHSLKDLPTSLPSNLTIGAVLKREDPRDALILNKNLNFKALKELPDLSVIGTSSLRRSAQLFRNYPNVVVENIRGNLNTRLRKLDDDNKYSGIILAAAGIKRMKLDERITQLFEPEELLYAVGQGALAVECRTRDENVLELLQVLNHADTILCVVAERSFLQTLGGGCSAPVAVCSSVKNEILFLTGAVWSLKGDKVIERKSSSKIGLEEPHAKISCLMAESHTGITVKNVCARDLEIAEKLGADLAKELIGLGALTVIQETKSYCEKQKPLSDCG